MTDPRDRLFHGLFTCTRARQCRRACAHGKDAVNRNARQVEQARSSALLHTVRSVANMTWDIIFNLLYLRRPTKLSMGCDDHRNPSSSASTKPSFSCECRVDEPRVDDVDERLRLRPRSCLRTILHPVPPTHGWPHYPPCRRSSADSTAAFECYGYRLWSQRACLLR